MVYFLENNQVDNSLKTDMRLRHTRLVAARLAENQVKRYRKSVNVQQYLGGAPQKAVLGTSGGSLRSQARQIVIADHHAYHHDKSGCTAMGGVVEVIAELAAEQGEPTASVDYDHRQNAQAPKIVYRGDVNGF